MVLIKRGNRTTHFGPAFSELNIFLVLDFLTQILSFSYILGLSRVAHLNQVTSHGDTKQAGRGPGGGGVECNPPSAWESWEVGEDREAL